MTEEQRLRKNASQKAWKERNKEAYSEYQKTWRANNLDWFLKYNIENIYNILLIRKRSEAKSKNIEFSLSLEEINFPPTCPVLGFPLDYNINKGKSQDNSPSFDRIDPKLGYISGNVQIISNLANRMKSNASEENLLKFAKWVIKESKKAERLKQ